VWEFNYREPGVGAIIFAKQYTKGLSRIEALPIVEQLLMGELHDQSDRRIKRCDYCGYYWRDDSLRNTKRTCGDYCKRKIKTLQTRQQRADKALLNPKPKKQTLMDDYLWWLEYPFWIQEYSMLKIGWKYEKPSGISVMDYVEANRSIYGDGNRKKATIHSNRILSGDK
jgi:hypothetical protein